MSPLLNRLRKMWKTQKHIFISYLNNEPSHVHESLVLFLVQESKNIIIDTIMFLIN